MDEIQVNLAIVYILMRIFDVLSYNLNYLLYFVLLGLLYETSCFEYTYTYIIKYFNSNFYYLNPVITSNHVHSILHSPSPHSQSFHSMDEQNFQTPTQKIEISVEFWFHLTHLYPLIHHFLYLGVKMMMIIQSFLLQSNCTITDI